MKIILTALLTIIVNLCAYTQDFRKHLLFLASESLHGRAPATADEQKAADYIQHQLLTAKCNKVSLQRFPFGDATSVNVIAQLDMKKDSTVIISAHYDHLGTGSDKSLDLSGKKGIYPGADDNASGVAMMLEVAETIAETKGWKYNFVFAGFSAHEAGLYGSDYFSKSALCSSLKIRAVINFDMVGRLNTSYPVIRISGSETDDRFSSFFKALPDESIHLRFDESNITESDLKPFAAMNIPVLNITTGTHSDYHRMTDTEDKINYDGMKMIFRFTETLLNIFKA